MEKLPSQAEKGHLKYCHFHCKIIHPTIECFFLRRHFNKKLKGGEIELAENNVDQTLFPTYKNEQVNTITEEVERSRIKSKEIMMEASVPI